MDKLNRFLWWCAGANIKILKVCPTDHAKYFGVGSTIIFTALMAGFAGGYAFFTAFKSTPLACAFGIFWGLLIFSLDRYIVSTIGKGDGTSKITWEEWKLAFPRLLMAVLLGFVISTPLELKIFEREIDTVVERLKINEAQDLQNRDSTYTNQLNKVEARLNTVRSEVSELIEKKEELAANAGAYVKQLEEEIQGDLDRKVGEIKALQLKVNSAQANYTQSLRDSLGSSTINYRRNIRDQLVVTRNNLRKDRDDLQKQKDDLKNERGDIVRNARAQLDQQLVTLNSEMDVLLKDEIRLKKTIDDRNADREGKLSNYNGFAAHLEAMNTLANEKPAIWWAKWLITLLFIFIEIAPVLFKLMAEAGPYDDIIDRIKHESYVRERQRISEINDEVNTQLKLSTGKHQVQLSAQLKGNQKLLDGIAEAQAEIAAQAIEDWKQKELAKLAKGQNAIVNVNSSNQHPPSGTA